MCSALKVGVKHFFLLVTYIRLKRLLKLEKM